MTSYSLVLLLLVPLLGAVTGACLPSRLARAWALLVSLATVAVGICISMEYRSHGTLEFVPQAASALRFATINFSFSLGLDSISLWLVLLTVILMPLAIVASY